MKPVPADDLWSKLDAAIAEARKPASPPPGAFDFQQFCERAHVGITRGRQLLRKLREAEIVKEVGLFSKRMYFIMK